METLTKTKWAIDPTHSEVQFKVKHLVISTVTGTFKDFTGSLDTDDDQFDGANVNFNLDVNSIDTNVADRDAHLKSDDFFYAVKYPEITFKGQLNQVDDESFKLIGELKIRDIVKEMSFDVTYGGQMVDGYGQTKAGFEITGTINRKEFGLNWDMITEAGGVVVADNVKLLLNIQLLQS